MQFDNRNNGGLIAELASLPHDHPIQISHLVRGCMSKQGALTEGDAALALSRTPSAMSQQGP